MDKWDKEPMSDLAEKMFIFSTGGLIIVYLLKAFLFAVVWLSN